MSEDTSQEERILLEKQAALELLSKLTGQELKPYALYNFVISGTLQAERKGKRMLFSQEAIEAAARILAEARSLSENKGGQELLTTQEALAYLKERGHDLKRGTFHHLAKKLAENHEIVLYTTDQPVRPAYLFSAESLNVIAAKLDEEQAKRAEMKAKGWYTLTEAAAYLSKREGRPIVIGLLYSRLNRGTLQAVHVEKESGGDQYYLDQATLDNLRVSPPRQDKLADIPPVRHISNISEVGELEEELGGKLITKGAALKILTKRAQEQPGNKNRKAYSEESLKQMKRRRVLFPRAEFGRALLYLKEDVERVHIAPKTGRRPLIGSDTAATSESGETQPLAAMAL